MKKYLIHSKIVLSVFFYFEIFSIVSAQNIYNSGASVNISSGIIVRGGSLSNTSGVIHNDGTLTLGGNLTNASSILGNGGSS